MESYILHIYRKEDPTSQQYSRRKTDQNRMAGVLELVASERRIPFHSAEQLWDLLTRASSKHVKENA